MKFLQRVKENNTQFKVPNHQKWSDDYRLMIEVENQKVEQIAAIINWCQEDSFWRMNILLSAKLRKQFDQLVIKALSGKKEKYS